MSKKKRTTQIKAYALLDMKTGKIYRNSFSGQYKFYKYLRDAELMSKYLEKTRVIKVDIFL
jgi:hypothetical protein